MIAYLDLPSGISGDMFLGCLLDAGWPVERLRAVATALALPLDEWSIDARQVSKRNIRATLADVRAMEGQSQRRLSEIVRTIAASTLPVEVRTRAVAVFTRLALAEAKVHGTDVKRIHFHEVGAVDAIIDIVGVIAGVHELGIERLFASAVPLGHGWTRSAHGPVPLPAPATLELLAAVHAPTTPAPGPGEWVTPTGAALLAELATFEQPQLAIEKIGVGAGQKDCAWPNVARLWIGNVQSGAAMLQLETNIDDMNPQIFASVSDVLFAAGARDVWFTPIQMKKNRPAVMLSVLGPASLESALTDVLLRETTTLGVRVHVLSHRHEARREMRNVETTYGTVRVKVKWIGDEIAGVMPEFDDCRALAVAAAVPVRLVQEQAMVAGLQLIQGMRSAGMTSP